MKKLTLIITLVILSSNLCLVFGEENQQDFKYGLGCLGSGFEEKDRISRAPALAELPISIDWRDFNGRNWMTPVKSQGLAGTCVAFGANAALEARLKIFYNEPYWNIDLSEQHLYEFGGGDPEGGMYVSDALDYLETFGTPEEWCNPYDPNTLFDYTVDEQWRLYTYKIKNWGWAWAGEIKQLLLDGPVVATMDVYLDFELYFWGVYRHSWGSYVGGHCVTIVGYDDVGGYWICKNSWGSLWGEWGYFRIAYGECGIEDYVSTFEVVDNKYPNLWVNIHRIQAVDPIESILEGEAEWKYWLYIHDGEEWLTEVGIVDYPYSENGDDVTIDHGFRFYVKNNLIYIWIKLFELDFLTEDDLADIGSWSGGGYDNYNGTMPKGAWYYGVYTLTNNFLTGNIYEIDDGFYKTSGLYDGSELIDQNDANLWFYVRASLSITPKIDGVFDQKAPFDQVWGGYCGDNLSVQGSGVTAGVDVNLYWDAVKPWDGEKGLLNVTEAEADGTFDIWFRVPEAVSGTHYLWVKDVFSGDTASYPFNVYTGFPIVSLSDDEASCGTEIILTGTGFTPNGDWGATMDGKTLFQDEAVGVFGDIMGGFYVPTLDVGAHTVTVVDMETGNEVPVEFEVTNKTLVLLNPAEAPKDYNVTIEGYYFANYEGCHLDFVLFNETHEWIMNVKQGSGVLERNAVLNENGNFTAWWIVPELDKGEYSINVTDEEDLFAQAVFNVRVITRISDIQNNIFDAPENSVYFVPTGNIYDDSALYAFYAYRENPQKFAHWWDFNGEGKPLFTENIVAFGGRFASPVVRYYEDNKIAKVGYGWNGTHHLFIEIDTGATLYAFEAAGFDQNVKDYFVIQAYMDGDRYVLSEWGYGAKGTYAAGLCFIDIIYPNIQEYTNQYYIYSWTDLIDDNMPQREEIQLEKTEG